MSCARRDGRHATRHLPCYAISVLAGNSSPSSTIACSRILYLVTFPVAAHTIVETLPNGQLATLVGSDRYYLLPEVVAPVLVAHIMG
jgi:hypothetical protein